MLYLNTNDHQGRVQFSPPFLLSTMHWLESLWNFARTFYGTALRSPCNGAAVMFVTGGEASVVSVTGHLVADTPGPENGKNFIQTPACPDRNFQ